MINITEEQLKDMVTNAHMAGQHSQTGCDPSYFEAESHWQKQVKNLGLFNVSNSVCDCELSSPVDPFDDFEKHICSKCSGFISQT